jgi:hypothetical protein
MLHEASNVRLYSAAQHTCMQRSDHGTVKWLLMGRHSGICVHTSGDLLPAALNTQHMADKHSMSWLRLVVRSCGIMGR